MKRLLLVFLLTFPLFMQTYGKRSLVWVLDPGHGGKDVGCEGVNCKEKDITLSITKEVARLIRANKPGIRVILTREKDATVSLDERCQKANNAGADLFLSIHVNYAINKPLLQGTESFYARDRKGDSRELQNARKRNMDKSELLAWLLQKNYYEAGRVADRGAKPEYLYVVMHTTMPSALTEVAFMSNTEEQNYIKTERGQKEVAATIYDALMEYYTTTQDNTYSRTLTNLRNSNGTESGVQCAKLAVRKERVLDTSDDPNNILSAEQMTEPILEPMMEPTVESMGQTDVAVQVESSEDVLIPFPLPNADGSIPVLEEPVSDIALIPVNEVPSVSVPLPEEGVVQPEPQVVTEPHPEMETVPVQPIAPEPQPEEQLELQLPEESAPPVINEEPELPVIKEEPAPPVIKEEPVPPVIKVEPAPEVQKPVADPKVEKAEVAQKTANVEKVEQKNVVENAAKAESAEKSAKASTNVLPVFSVQIVSVSSEVKSDDPRLKGLSPVTFVRSGNSFKGLYGGTTSYKQARETLASIREKFPDAFIVAYLGDEAIPTSRALEMQIRK